MTNFELKIIPTDQKIVLLAESGFGEAVVQVEKLFFSEMIEKSKQLRMMYSDLLYNLYPSFIEKVEQTTSEFGTKLFDGIFQGKIINLLNRTIGGSITGQLNIRLMLGEPGLNTIQWETMRFRNEYIGLKHNLIRHPFTPYPVRVPSASGNKLHILVVSVDPIYGDQYIGEEHQSIVKMFEGFGDQIRVSELFQKEATIDDIKDKLFEGVDIWHFAGHGMFDPQNPLDSALIVWGDRNQKYGKLSIRLLSTLAMNQNLGFCFLNACSTARGGEIEDEEEFKYTKDHFVNMAHSLIEVGVPIVVATNHTITVNAAILLSNRFYKSVIKYGKRIDQAVRDARADLYISAKDELLFSDWSCPVLYARSRYMEFGTERLRWEPSFDIYSMRNIKPSLVEAVR